MTPAGSTQTLALNPELANPITEAKSKDREWNGDENEQLLRQRNDKFDPRRQRFQRNLSSEKSSGAGRAEAVGFDERPLTVTPTSF